jgi:predicted alpha-1,2-mannosidase
MVQWSPDTSNGFYSYDAHRVTGFSLTYLSGIGCPLFADMPMLPMSERPATQFDQDHPPTTAFGHKEEIAQPGYSVVPDDGTRVEITASDRSGMARITFAQGSHASLLLNGPGSASTNVHMSFLPPLGREQDGDHLSYASDGMVRGTVTSGGFCGSPTRYTLHVAYQTKTSPKGHVLWQDGKIVESASQAQGHHSVMWLDLGDARTQLVKVGLSYVSEEKAIANLKAEMPGWDFDALRQDAAQQWSKILASADVEGASAEERKIFYTGLYHAAASQTLFNDVDGEYMGFDNQVHKLHAGQRAQYTNISDWDTYRNTVQLQALLFPQQAGDLAQSLVNDAEQLGSSPRWATANDGSYVMGGDSPPIILASIYAFGVRNFDAQSALRYAVKAATEPGLGEHGRFERDDLSDYLKLGYISSANLIAVSETLEFANADFAIGHFAGSLGDKSTEALFLKRAKNWRNLLDPETRWTRPRAPDGTWMPGFDAEKSLPHRPKASVPTDQYGFEEGNTYQYTFMIPFDYAGLFDAIGDKAIVEQRLDRFFQKLICWGEPCFNMANEPDFVTPYAYTFFGKPWKTSEILTSIEDQAFNAGPGGIPGNDDLGATSGVYVWNTMGMYPAIPGLGGVVLGTPRFTHVMLHLNGGNTFSIERVGKGNVVDSVTVNGDPYTSSWLPIQKILGGGTRVVFHMADRIGSSWGTAPTDLPPSLSTGILR